MADVDYVMGTISARYVLMLYLLRGQYTGKVKFVLTHADLHSENIHVCRVMDSKGKSTWELSGILDWGRSGFSPEYMEYAMAMKSGPYRPYWQNVMKAVLKGLECSKKRVKVEEHATQVGSIAAF